MTLGRCAAPFDGISKLARKHVAVSGTATFNTMPLYYGAVNFEGMSNFHVTGNLCQKIGRFESEKN